MEPIWSTEIGFKYKFSEEFRKYVKEENLLCWATALFCTDFYVFNKAHAPDDGVALECRRLVDSLISCFKRDGFRMWRSLVQFWAAEEVVNSVDDISHTNYRLTTRYLPFLLGNIRSWDPVNEELCLYRMKTCDVSFAGDGGGGAIGRVFRNKRVEYTPDVACYSSEEYPLRDVALSCDIKNSLVVPWFDSYRKVVGVIEFVSLWNPYCFTKVLEYFNGYLSSSLGVVVDRCQGLYAQDLEKDLLTSALSEIKHVTRMVFESRSIQMARTWMLCNSCNSLSSCQKTSWRGSFGTRYYFQEARTSCLLQKGEGVVGKAAESSHNLVYCENVAKFSIVEYPLAHFARTCSLFACFALSLRSSYTGDQIYILEFFLSPWYVRGMDLRTLLVPILDQMKRDFRTFKVAFGREELGNRLPVLVTDANSPDKLETLIGLKTLMEDTPMEYVSVASASTVQSEFHVTINAKYGEDHFIRFQLSPSSGIHGLYHQLSQRLGLVDGTYDLKYLDEENDLIELTCDEDLQLYISNLVLDEISTLMVLIVPK